MGKKAIFLEILFGAVAMFTALVVHETTHDWSIALATALFVELLIQVYRLRIEYGPFLTKLADRFDEAQHPFDMLTRLARRTIPVELLTERPTEWIFEEHYDRLVEEFRQHLASLARGSFTVPMQDIPDPSFVVCQHLEESAFCTAPQANLEIFTSGRGIELKQENFRAAQRLKARSGFVRLFIFRDFQSITWEHYCLMEENQANDISTLVALEEMILQVLEHYDWKSRADFGLWDGEYLMTIKNEAGVRSMEVSKEPSLLRQAGEVVKGLQKAAWSWEEFQREFSRPINEKYWSSTPQAQVALPPTNGPAPEDCKGDLQHVAKYFGG